MEKTFSLIICAVGLVIKLQVGNNRNKRTTMLQLFFSYPLQSLIMILADVFVSNALIKQGWKKGCFNHHMDLH